MTAGRAWLPALAVAAIALAASLAGIGNELAQDDLILIARNPRLHDLGNWWEILTSPFWPPPYTEYLYRPLTALLLAVEHVLGGGSALVFRVVSYLAYAAAGAGMFFLARRVLPAMVAAAAALLFAAHPVHVEAVAQAVSQAELLVGLLATAMVGCYLDRRRAGSGRLKAADWAILGALYLGACLLKEHALVLPGLLLGAELLVESRPGAPRRGLAPGFLFLGALGGLFLMARTAVLGSGTGTFPAEALEGAGAGGRALTMLRVVPEWIRLLGWPADLQTDYSPGEIVAASGFGATEALGLAILVAALMTAWVSRRRAPAISFGLLWTGIALIPVSNVLLPTGIVLAERTLFLPSMGMLIAGGGVVAALLERLDARRPGSASRAARPVLALLMTGLVVAGTLRSAARHRVWRSEESLALAGAEDAPLSYRAQQAYGYQLFESGLRERAAEAYQRAIALAPERHAWRVRNDLARRYFSEGRYDLAVDQLRESLAQAPDREETWNYLVLGYLGLGDYREAARLSDSALARGASPEIFRGHRALADSAIREGAPAGSIRIRVRPAPPGGRER